jgi:hypothetical protein
MNAADKKLQNKIYNKSVPKGTKKADKIAGFIVWLEERNALLAEYRKIIEKEVAETKRCFGEHYEYHFQEGENGLLTEEDEDDELPEDYVEKDIKPDIKYFSNESIKRLTETMRYLVEEVMIDYDDYDPDADEDGDDADELTEMGGDLMAEVMAVVAKYDAEKK